MNNYSNIVWIKNIKRNQGKEWAYADKICGETFLLNWPSSKPGSASTPKIGDIIVLFQNPEIINGKRNYDVHFTHLVSAISEEVKEDPLSPEHKWCREVRLIAKANPISSIPNPGYYDFFKPNRGLTNPIINLENKIGLSEDEKKEDIWRLFSNHFCEDLKNEIEWPAENPKDFGELEGDKIIKEHIKIETSRRNGRIIRLAKVNAALKNNGRLNCECCNFDFLDTYGNIGSEFIECHHKQHISSGERITKIRDLALVCSNCHRMLHRKKDDGTYHNVDSLKQVYKSN